ncbi:hypothetical protein NUU61_008338 [Penicillium alfredii]|uniref:Uncharacterized protein n=1 Tax=Penicillium alfredii TaxID=1506179 RepID=A0A9W9JZF2_9EURO|nr:uncharacterized protein NUU61_008338 [Penicillium alfredii]KAJ5087031.1 hypothetical protein NUU61_008338 [Penicillium alfredii]
MPLFSKKSKAPPASSTPATSQPVYLPVRSAENLLHPALAPPDPNAPIQDNSYGRRLSDYRFVYDDPPLGPVLPQQQPPPEQPSSLSRSFSQRQSRSQRDRPTNNPVAPEEDLQPRRLKKKSLFVRPSSGILERSISVKGKSISHPLSQPGSPRLPQSVSLPTTEEHPLPGPQPHEEGNYPALVQPYEPRSTSLAYQQQHQQIQRDQQLTHPAHRTENQEWAQQQPIQPPNPDQTRRPPPPLQLQRSNTDQSRPSPTDSAAESPRPDPDQVPRGQPQPHPLAQDPVLNSRPSSRQTSEPLSPLNSQTHPDAMQHAPAQAPPQAQGQPQQPTERQSGPPPQDSSRRGSASQGMPDQGRSTPTGGNRAREESGDTDIRALIQKHDELQAKYSKVKRYYFEKDAQVQHLQNTVAHQRMAVSRTVLDDNEYTNRFQRLDGAIKDLAFSVRKEWRGIPPWLHGQVTDDAVSVGTKEMTAVGRAIISRWLVDEIFHRHFHPALEPHFSMQLKSIEMNLRRQQARPATDEDRDNAAVRLSNWRRTTFDGLGDILIGPAAEEHRAELIEHLSAELASFMGSQLHEPALAGLEAGVRMIIENSINIAEKIPLEARDVCVEYFPPNIQLADLYMKVEGGLPPLNHPLVGPGDHEAEEPPTTEGDSSSGSNSGPGEGQPRAKKSVFGALMGRKSAPEANRPAAGNSPDDKADLPESAPAPTRIRFASFLAVEVRGKAPSTVLIKAPVWLE